MAVDKLVDSAQLDTDLTSVANAIRTKGGTSASIAFPSGFVTAIGNISTGGTPRTSDDLEVSGATVTAPAGTYASAASKSVASGTAGTPTATKGIISNHSVDVTPSVTNSAGYITSDTKTGTPVTVSASELVSGTDSVTSSGTKDVTNYASASVPAGTEGTPTATKGTVNNHSISVTPSVTNSGGYITGSTKTGTAVTVSASELVSGSETKTANGTYDVTNLAQLIVNVAGGSTGPYDYWGPGTTLVDTKTKTYNLSTDTTYDSWTASTSSSTISASPSANEFTLTYNDLATYAYTVVCSMTVDIALKPTATKKQVPIKWGISYFNNVIPKWNNGTEFESGTYTGSSSIPSQPPNVSTALRYYTSTGSRGFSNSSYGPMYCTNDPTITFATSSGTVTITLKRPSIQARCSNTYFATARKTEVDSANTNMTINWYIYKTPVANCGRYAEQEKIRQFLLS